MYTPTRVLIFAKTYPDLSAKYTETVCTGGFREDGAPIRLYPVPLRYLEGEHQYKLYEWVRVPIRKSTSDPRPESYKIDPEKIVREGIIPPDDEGWRQRQQVVFRDTSWHFGNMEELRAAQKATKRSIGMVTPGKIDDVELITKPASERIAFEQKTRALQSKQASDLFAPDFKRLSYLPKEIRLLWRCIEACPTCKKQPHGMKILDWGLLELARKNNWEAALSKMRDIADMKKHDFRLFLGNFRLHQTTFGIIGLWYPRIPNQYALL